MELNLWLWDHDQSRQGSNPGTTKSWPETKSQPTEPRTCPNFKFFFKMFIYLFWEREQEERGVERVREWKWEWASKRIPSRLCTVSMEPDAGLKPMKYEIMTWAKVKSWRLNRLSYPGAPKYYVLIYKQGDPLKKLICCFFFLFFSFILISLKTFFFSLFILRERMSEQGRGRERGRERESQAASALSAQSLRWDSNSRTVRAWPELKSRVGRITN